MKNMPSTSKENQDIKKVTEKKPTTNNVLIIYVFIHFRFNLLISLRILQIRIRTREKFNTKDFQSSLKRSHTKSKLRRP